jgi:Zn-dependent peptidase ImmA (M78 family)
MSAVTARHAAKKVSSEFRGDNKTIDLKIIAKAWGVEIHTRPFDDDTSGVLVVDKSKTMIVVNSKEAKERQNFTIGHELGHFHLHKKIDVHVDKTITIMARNDDSRLGKKMNEVEANQFAAELLMPESFLKKDAKDFSDGLDKKAVEKFAKNYSVSVSAMKTRLEFLKLI